MQHFESIRTDSHLLFRILVLSISTNRFGWFRSNRCIVSCVLRGPLKTQRKRRDRFSLSVDTGSLPVTPPPSLSLPQRLLPKRAPSQHRSLPHAALLHRLHAPLVSPRNRRRERRERRRVGGGWADAYVRDSGTVQCQRAEPEAELSRVRGHLQHPALTTSELECCRPSPQQAGAR